MKEVAKEAHQEANRRKVPLELRAMYGFDMDFDWVERHRSQQGI